MSFHQNFSPILGLNVQIYYSIVNSLTSVTYAYFARLIIVRNTMILFLSSILYIDQYNAQNVHFPKIITAKTSNKMYVTAEQYIFINII